MEFYKYERESVINYWIHFAFLAETFQSVVNRQIFAGNLATAQTIRKEKYPKEFCPEVSTKEYM